MTGKPRRLIFFLAAVTLAILGIHVATLVVDYGFGHDHVFGMRELFDVDRERNVPAVFSFCLLLFASILLAVITARQKRGSRPRRVLWAGLAAIFLYLAIDEGMEVHEGVSVLTAKAANAPQFYFYAWVIPYGIAALIFAAVYLRFLLDLPRDIRIQFIVAGSLFVFGALGAEAIAGVYVYFYHTEATLGYDLISAFEELLEMTGVVWFIHALTRYLDHQAATRVEGPS